MASGRRARIATSVVIAIGWAQLRLASISACDPLLRIEPVKVAPQLKFPCRQRRRSDEGLYRSSTVSGSYE
jgi:hypothetical protein